MDLEQLGRKTKEAASLIGKSGAREYTIEALLLDLMEEVGELANAVLVEEGHKGVQRKKAELADSICDVLFDLLRIADHYGIRVEQEYRKMLEALKKRAKNREFV